MVALAIAALALGGGASGCRRRPAPPAGGSTGQASGAGSAAAAGAGSPGSPASPGAPGGGSSPAAPSVPDPAWVTVYNPAQAWNGFTLTLHDARVPVLLDMDGRVVHSWPAARVKSRVRLLPDGSILGLGLGRQIVEYDWDGRQTWVFRTPDAIPHHDVLRLANGNTLVLVQVDGEGEDTLYEVARGGRVVWTWRAAEHRRGLIPARPAHAEDVTHINSIQELPPNPWYAAGDGRFKPGNLLVSARNLNSIFVVERPAGRVAWIYTAELDRQHEARMNGPDLPAPGVIQVFNNRLGSFWGDHQSELLELDPRRGAVTWRFRMPGFFSPTGGVAQRLPNGNDLVTSTRGGRVFEITPAGRIAWEWVPPYEPVRAERVAAAACPQLAGLARRDAATLRPVAPPPGYLHVDPDAYRFARQGSRTDVEVEGETHTVLKEESDCRNLMLPPAAAIQLGYGVDRTRLRAAGRAARPPRFVVRLRPAGAARPLEILNDTVGLTGDAWRERTIDLRGHSLQLVELCLDIDPDDDDTAPAAGSAASANSAGSAASAAAAAARFAWWEQPDIVSRDPRASQFTAGDLAARPDLTPEEQEVRRRLLKSLGYIN